MQYPKLRSKIIEVFNTLIEKNLTHGRSGNISVRIKKKNLFLITPSGIRKHFLKPENILLIDNNENIIEGRGIPSIETSMHLTIYKSRIDVNAIIHAHPVYSSIFAVLNTEIPPILEETTIYTGGEIKVAKFAPAGSKELAKNVAKALGNRKAVLLSNHGILTCGKDLDEAFDILISVENTAKIYLYAKLLGKPKILQGKI